MFSSFSRVVVVSACAESRPYPRRTKNRKETKKNCDTFFTRRTRTRRKREMDSENNTNNRNDASQRTTTRDNNDNKRASKNRRETLMILAFVSSSSFSSLLLSSSSKTANATGLEEYNKEIDLFRPENIDISDEFKEISQWGDPPVFLRKTLEIALAVALLRSSYDAIDELNICAMDEFQIKSWKTRQLSYEAYKALIYPLAMEQGDLKNPLYFDHMSFSQYSTLNAILNRNNGKPDMEFDEKLGFDGEVKRVKRDENFPTRKELIPAFSYLVGRNIFNFFKNGFELTEDKPFDGVPEFINLNGSKTSSVTSDTKIVDGVKALLQVFLNYGFCKEFQVSLRDGKLIVNVIGPAMLWSIGALENEGARVVNDYIGYTTSYYLYKSGITSKRRYAKTDSSMVYTFDLFV